VITGGVLGIVMMRLVAGQMIELIRRYPALVDGAFIIIGWVAVKLIVEYLHHLGWIGWRIDTRLSLTLIVVIFLASYLYARRHPSDSGSAVPPAETPDSSGG
jgi:predicted tellurium resistance membrane protein TerC